jgi:GNAT superfamily N-acetyltransferase
MVREMQKRDVRAAAELVRRSWARSYVDIVPPHEHPTVDEQAADLAPRHGQRGWVFDLDGVVVAVALVVGPDSEDPELSLLHVAPAAQGAGVGSELHDAVLADLRAMGRTCLHLWVYEENGHARDFYAARGWARDDGGNKPDRYGAAQAIRMTRAL